MKTNLPTQLEVGVDISKHTLSVFYDQKLLNLPNTAKGINNLISKLKKAKRPFRITCESTGSYGDLLIRLALKNEIAISQVNPVFIKDYIRSFGRLAKTDAIDAQFIARYATDRQPSLLSKGLLEILDLKEAHRQLRQLISIRAQLKASLDKYVVTACRKGMEKHLRYLDREIKKIEEQLLMDIQENEAMKAKFEKIIKVSSVGPKTAMSLLLEMPELGTLNRGQVAALAGLAPMHNESGKLQGNRHIQRGRKGPRSLLYMAAFNASFKNSVLKPFYQRLIAAGKSHQVAVIAVARKLLIYLNTLLKSETQKT